MQRTISPKPRFSEQSYERVAFAEDKQQHCEMSPEHNAAGQREAKQG
jgi:hypothetical protein